MSAPIRTSQRGSRAPSRRWVEARAGATLLRDREGRLELLASAAPKDDAAQDLGASDRRFRHAWVAELHTGDLCLQRLTPEGPASWRIVEWPDRIEATDQQGRRHTLLLVAQDGPPWKRALRRALLSILT
jgi:hypothetical protein